MINCIFCCNIPIVVIAGMSIAFCFTLHVTNNWILSVINILLFLIDRFAAWKQALAEQLKVTTRNHIETDV